MPGRVMQCEQDHLLPWSFKYPLAVFQCSCFWKLKECHQTSLSICPSPTIFLALVASVSLCSLDLFLFVIEKFPPVMGKKPYNWQPSFQRGEKTTSIQDPYLLPNGRILIHPALNQSFMCLALRHRVGSRVGLCPKPRFYGRTMAKAPLLWSWGEQASGC